MSVRNAIMILPLFLVLSASSAMALSGEADPTAIQKEIDRLRVFYTDEHPDIQIMKRHLEKALAREEAEKAREEERRRLENLKK